MMKFAAALSSFPHHLAKEARTRLKSIIKLAVQARLTPIKRPLCSSWTPFSRERYTKIKLSSKRSYSHFSYKGLLFFICCHLFNWKKKKTIILNLKTYWKILLRHHLKIQPCLLTVLFRTLNLNSTKILWGNSGRISLYSWQKLSQSWKVIFWDSLAETTCKLILQSRMMPISSWQGKSITLWLGQNHRRSVVFNHQQPFKAPDAAFLMPKLNWKLGKGNSRSLRRSRPRVTRTAWSYKQRTTRIVEWGRLGRKSEIAKYWSILRDPIWTT